MIFLTCSLTLFSIKQIDDRKESIDYFKKGNLLNKSIKCFDKSIALNSNTYFNKGKVLIYLKRYQDAISCQNKVIESKPDHFLACIDKDSALEILNKNENKKSNDITI